MRILDSGRTWIPTAVLCLALSSIVHASGDPALSKDQVKQFLLNAKVVHGSVSSKGVTHPWRLTLSDGTLTHDASFQAVDEHKSSEKLVGRTEHNFVDSYKYNIAAYELAELLGLDDMVPVYVERKWEGKVGSLSWWLPVKMDAGERLKRHIPVPDSDAWNKQMYKVLVFDQLVYDTDDNMTNLLITEDWKLWRIDFTRAFRLWNTVATPKNLMHCDRHLFSKLKTLDGGEVATRTKGFLTKPEVESALTYTLSPSEALPIAA